MDCKKVRDQFSSLWEHQLIPSEEKNVREHLSSCPECQKELEQFEKTMRWLHSVAEVEIPEGFLPELHKKMEERKSEKILAEKARGRWFNLPLALKLPVQATAMVAIIFLVLYLTKMMPFEGEHLKDSKPISSPFAEKKSNQVFVQKEVEKEKKAVEIHPETSRPRGMEQAKPHVPPEKGKLERTYAPQLKAEVKKGEEPSQKTEVMEDQTLAKETAGMKALSPDLEETEKGWTGREKPMVTSGPPQEIVLRVSDQKKVISQLHELVKQFGGEIITSEENMVLASLPAGAFSEFENELVGIIASLKADKINVKEHVPGSLRMARGRKREEGDNKIQGSSRVITGQENRTEVRILLIQE
jgi:hypothetical protein